MMIYQSQRSENKLKDFKTLHWLIDKSFNVFRRHTQIFFLFARKTLTHTRQFFFLLVLCLRTVRLWIGGDYIEGKNQ